MKSKRKDLDVVIVKNLQETTYHAVGTHSPRNAVMMAYARYVDRDWYPENLNEKYGRKVESILDGQYWQCGDFAALQLSGSAGEDDRLNQQAWAYAFNYERSIAGEPLDFFTLRSIARSHKAWLIAHGGDVS